MVTDGSARRPRRWSALVPVVVALAGLLFATTARVSHGTELRSARSASLAQLVAEQQRLVAGYGQTAGALRAQVDRAAAKVARRDAAVAAVQQDAAALAGAAGTTPMRGPAVTVSLSDAPRTRPGGGGGAASPDDLVVHQQDVQAVVNALWAGGARGMTLMGERVIGTSAVRCVGNTLILHGVVYSPPYVVTAVGDIATMRAALDRDPGVSLFREYVDAYGLGYAVSAASVATLPAYAGPLPLASAG